MTRALSLDKKELYKALKMMNQNAEEQKQTKSQLLSGHQKTSHREESINLPDES